MMVPFFGDEYITVVVIAPTFLHLFSSISFRTMSTTVSCSTYSSFSFSSSLARCQAEIVDNNLPLPKASPINFDYRCVPIVVVVVVLAVLRVGSIVLVREKTFHNWWVESPSN